MLVWEAGRHLHWLYLSGAHDPGPAGESAQFGFCTQLHKCFMRFGVCRSFSIFYLFGASPFTSLITFSMIYVCNFILIVFIFILKCAKSSAFSLPLSIFRLTSFFSSTLWGSWWLNWGPPPPQRPFSTGEADYSALTDPTGKPRRLAIHNTLKSEFSFHFG